MAYSINTVSLSFAARQFAFLVIILKGNAFVLERGDSCLLTLKALI